MSSATRSYYNFALIPLTIERGVEYEFRVAAKNHVDFGESAFEVIQTPDGGRNLGSTLL